MKDNIIAYSYLRERGVTRLCHFTKIKSLVHILTSEDGILATDFIKQDVKQQNDLQRFDNATDHVSCSLQYPNSWYWKKAKNRDTDKIFKEWIVLSIGLEILKEQLFKFCPCNAAKEGGRYIRDDVVKIADIFVSPTIDSRTRTPKMLNCCPTDDQAEILVNKNVPLRFVNGIIVGDNDSANNISAILKTIGKDISVFISSSVCNTNWSGLVRNGQAPQEAKYDYRGD